MIKINNISFSYGDYRVLEDISFEAEAGDRVAILGNNGAGKSTLVTCINRIRQPKTGTVDIDGEDILKMERNELARTVAYVAQKSELSRMTVFDAVLLGRKPYIKWTTSQEDLDLCDEMIEKVGMESFKLRNVDELSGGETQKVMLARALVQQPKLLLLDEPTSNLDPKNQVEMLRLVGTAAAEHGLCVLVVIHDLSLALRFCNKFLFIKNGRVYRYGDESIVTDRLLAEIYDIEAEIVQVGEKKAVLFG